MKKLLSFAALAAALAMAGCGGSGGDNPPPGFAYLRFINASPDSVVDVSFRDGEQTVDDLAFGEPAPPNDEAPEAIEPGNGTIVFTVPGEVSTDFSRTLNFDANHVYTAVFAGLVGNEGENAPRIIVTSDRTSDFTLTQANFRFIHASTAVTTPVDVYLMAPDGDLATETPDATNVARFGSSGLLKLNGGNQRIVVTEAGTKTVVVDLTSEVDTGTYGVVVAMDNEEGTGAVLEAFGSNL